MSFNQQGCDLLWKKVAKIRDYPTPKNEKELDQFLYMTLYLKRYIAGRAEHAKVMKEAVLWEKKKEESRKQRGVRRLRLGGSGTSGNRPHYNI